MITISDRRYVFQEPVLATPTTGTRFPFDRDFLNLWNACQRAGWEVDDWTFEFRLYGGAQKILGLRSIRGTLDGQPFYLRMNRFEKHKPLVDGYIVDCSLGDIGLPLENGNPAMYIETYGDLSGPVARMCVSPVWGANVAENFYAGAFHHERINGELRTTIHYRAVGAHDERDGHAITLENHDDCGREYIADGVSEPVALNVAALYGRARDYVRRLTLRAQSAPEKARDVMAILGQKSEPAPEGFELRTRVSHHQVKTGTGYENWRLLSLDVPKDPTGKVPERAYDGFTYCFQAPADPIGDDRSLLRFSSDAVLMARIRPKVLNDIFVIDEGPALAYREGIWSERDRLTRDELIEFYHMLARTMVPASSYKGGFGHPVWLIGRDLLRDEVEVHHRIEGLTREDRLAMKPDEVGAGG